MNDDLLLAHLRAHPGEILTAPGVRVFKLQEMEQSDPGVVRWWVAICLPGETLSLDGDYRRVLTPRGERIVYLPPGQALPPEWRDLGPFDVDAGDQP